MQQLIEQIKSALTPDLLKPQYLNLQNLGGPTAGHCYHAAEALYYILSSSEDGWVPHVYREEDGITHWWLKHVDGRIADPTVDQYGNDPLPYERGLGKGCGFLTKKPSRRAQIILDRIGWNLIA